FAGGFRLRSVRLVAMVAMALASLAVLPVPSRAAVQARSPQTSGRDSGAALNPPESLETNLCTEQLLMSDPNTGPSWNGWGNGPANARFQPKSQGKLTASNLHRLQLKWAFGYAHVASARPQPTIAGGRLFAASENGHVYALNPKTGCRYWTYE